MIGERLHRARKAAGLSLRDLAKEAAISHTWVNKFEQDKAMPDSKTLLKIGKALGVRTEYFFRPEKVALSQIEYRKKSGLGKKRLDAIEHEIMDRIERRIEIENLFPESPVQVFELPLALPDKIHGYDEIEDVANNVRQEWALGMNPIPSLIDLLEVNGVRVFCIDAREDSKFDGLSAHVEGVPVVIVGKYWPGDRQRFTLAHELGHLILSDRLSEDLKEENACNRFAGAFLLPDCSVKASLGARRSFLEDLELYSLKHEFGLSMAAVMRRALDLGIIREGYYRSLNIRFNKKGWRKSEPGKEIKPETGKVFRNLVFRALAEEYIGESKAAELLGLSLDGFRSRRSMKETDASSCQ